MKGTLIISVALLSASPLKGILVESFSCHQNVKVMRRRPYELPQARRSLEIPTKCFSSSGTTELPETSPLPQHTFAGMVEHAMATKFGRENVERVIESWRLLDRGYEHREFLGPKDMDPQSSRCHQHAHSYVPGLSAKPFWNTDDFPWCKKLKSKYKQMYREFKQATENMERLQSEGNNVWAGALTDDASSYGEGWRTLVLMDRGRWDPVNCNLFPVAAKAVYDSGAPVVEVFFASMKPQTDIKPHSDFTNFVLTSHLGMDIPYSGENKCRLTIGDETREWINGEIMMFDTSIIHDAVNESDKTRYILMLRLWHPDLSETEKQALQFTYDALAFPDLLSDDPMKRRQAEEEAEALRAFPVYKGTGSKQGFGGNSSAAPKGKKGKR